MVRKTKKALEGVKKGSLSKQTRRNKRSVLMILPLTGTMTYPLKTKLEVETCPKCDSRMNSILEHLGGVSYLKWERCNRCGHETRKKPEDRVVTTIIPTKGNSVQVSTMGNSTLSLHLWTKQKESWVYIDTTDTKLEWSELYAVLLFCQADMENNLVPLPSVRHTNIEGNFVLGKITDVGGKV